jgi:type IV secretion system protein VirB4
VLDLRKQRKSFADSKPLHSLLNIAAFISDTAFLTKSGDVGSVIEIRGTDTECLEPSVVDSQTAQTESAMKAFNEDFVVNTYLLKCSNPALTAPVYQNPVLNEAVQSRLEHLRKKGATLYTFEAFTVVVFKSKWVAPRVAERLWEWARSPRKALRQSLRVEHRGLALDETIEHSLKTLDSAVSRFREESVGALTSRVLPKRETFDLFRRFLNFSREKAEAVTLTQDLHVDYWACDSELEVHRSHLRFDDDFVKVLTLKRPPAKTFAHILRDLQRVQTNLIVATEWNVCENSRAVADIRSKRRHWHNTKLSLLSQVGTEKPYERELLFDDSKEALVADLGSCLTDIEMEGVQVGWFSLTVILVGLTLESVERGAAEVMKIFGTHEAALNEERYNSLNAFLAALPGGYPFNLRNMLITNRNHADLCSWFLPAEGERRCEFLQRESSLVLETEENSLYFYSPYVGDVGHTAVVGPPGTGKSFNLNFLITHFQAYSPYTFIFGIGGDFRWLTERFGGTYLRCAPGKQPFSMNPFLLEPAPGNLEFQFAFAKLLAESGDFRMSDSHARELFEGIRHLHVLAPELRRLSTLATTVSKAVGDRLRPWTEGEQYGTWFDNPTDTLTFGSFQYVDFEGMERLGTVLEAVLFYLLHRANDIIYDEGLRTTLKVFFIDEAWRFLRHPVTRAYILEALRTWRKKNGLVTLSTQSAQDLAGEDILRSIVENCPTKLLLSNPQLDSAVYGDLFGLTNTEQARVRTLTSKRQFLLKRDKLSKVLNLNVDPKSYWLFTTNPYEAKRRDEAIARVGLHAALDLLAKEIPQ